MQLILSHAAVSLIALWLTAVAVPVTAQGSVDLTPGGSIDTTVAIPDSITILNEQNFDAYVFPEGRKASPREGTETKLPQAWFIFVYAPWCQHCRGIMPQFINASIYLDVAAPTDGGASRFAVLNAQKNLQLAERFNVEHFPTLLYTTGRGRQVHQFDGGHSFDSFVQFAVYLQRAAVAGSFADDVSDPQRFAAVEAESGLYRVPFYIYVPASSPVNPDNKREALWLDVINGVASIGNCRFGVLYEASAPAVVPENATTYAAVVQAAKACVAAGDGSGPGGEVLLSTSDRFRTPQCYNGPWLSKAQDGKEDGLGTANPLLVQYITVNGFRAVEELNGGMFSVLGKQDMNFLGLLVHQGPLDQADPNYLPVLREMVQRANEATRDVPVEEALQVPRVTWAYIDGSLYSFWRTRYKIEEAEMPAVLLVDPIRNRLYRARNFEPNFELIKRDVPWALYGPQQQALERLVGAALSGSHYGEKLSTVGWLAERLSYLPGWSQVYGILAYDDFTFMIVVAATSFFVFLLFVGVMLDPMAERLRVAKQTKAATTLTHPKKGQ